MGKTDITSWRDLTLLQFGSLLKTANQDRQILSGWQVLADSIHQAEKTHRSRGKKRNGQEPQVNSTKTLLAYFFTFTAVIHKRFLCPGQGLDLDEIVKEYALDLLTGNPSQNKFFGKDFPRLLPRDDFTSNFAAIVPNQTLSLESICLDPSEVGDHLEGIKWGKNLDDEGCAEEGWYILLGYLMEEDVPTPRIRTEDAFAWLEEKNQHAYHTILNINDQPLFDCRCLCEMGECYPRFLRQLDDWNPYCMRMWDEFQRKAPFRFPELSAALKITSGGNSHV